MLLAARMASSPEMRRLFSARASVQAMLAVEAALTQAGVAIGRVTPEAAVAISIAAGHPERIDLKQLAADGALAGTVVIPLVKWLKAQVPGFEASVHLGGTSQDIIDTALVLQLRDGVQALQSDLAAMANAAAALAQDHADTKISGRTLLQAALPTSFGLKAANWLVAINDSRRAIRHAAAEALVLQCGGAAGTLDVLGAQAMDFLAALGALLELPVPPTPWHTRRAPLARLAAAIAGAVGVAGKIGTDIALMMQAEVGEVSEPAAPGRGGSSAMAHKRNPTLSIAARAAATRMPGFVANLLAAQDQEHERAAGAWQAEAATWPELMLCASGGLAAMAEALPGLILRPDAMARNLTHLPDAPLPPAVSALIARALDDHHKLHSELDFS